MAVYITIDGGTSNTRISLVKNNEVTDTIKLCIGAKAGIENKKALKNAVRGGISELLSNNSLSENNITRILASGMITSEFGLYNLAHLTVPVGIQELHDGMCEVMMREISEIPIVFIRGVRTKCETLETADMMRGEETELMGITERSKEECVFILPGSHSKIIHTDEDGRIDSFSTMLTGEMASALSQGTILKAAVDLSASNTDREYLIKGYEYGTKNGINEALFKVRILKNIFKGSKEQIYSFFWGVILCGEIAQILESNAGKVVIGGQRRLREALAELLKVYTEKTIISLSEDIVSSSTAIGAVRIYEQEV